MKLTYDTDAILFKVLKDCAAITSSITGGIYTGDDARPDNSAKEDIAINTIDITQEFLPQIGVSNVNIHVPDKTITIGGVQQKKADRARLTQLARLVTDTLKAANIEGLKLIVTNQKELAQPEISQHFVNIRIEWNIHQ